MFNKIINISFITDDALNTLYSNPQKATELIRSNPFDSSWLKEIMNRDPFELRKAKIEDFELKTSPNGVYKEVEYENAICLYEHLKDLPRYILIDERFWVWLELGKFYRVAVQSMPVKKDTAFEGQWIFTRGNKRGLWFNVFSRSYFWVEFTVDENAKDKYELTKFAFEKIERIRHLTFDSKYRNIVFNSLKAEKKLYDKYANDPEYSETFRNCESGIGSYNIYTYLRKALSLYGSVRILDFMSADDIFNVAYQKLEKAFFEVHNGNIEYLMH